MTYIWQQKAWPSFSWNTSRILNPLSEARKKQGYLLGKADFLGLESEAEVFVEEAFKTSAIEGEQIDPNAIRSSVAKRLGLPTAGLPDIQRHSDGLVEILMDVSRNYDTSLSKARVCGWHGGLFPTGFSGIKKIPVGSYRKSKEPMQVISGNMGKEKVHYEAPPSDKVAHEMKIFLEWFNNTEGKIDGIIRAGIAHFWFVTIHPFEDGNGRLARSICDLALAQDEKSSRRLYSLSEQIMKHRKDYYEVLESSQKGSCDLTDWLSWFVKMFSSAMDASKALIAKAEYIAGFYKKIGSMTINERQGKVIRKMLEAWPDGFEGGITNKKYVSMTKTSSETAKRDLRDLVEKQVLIPNEGRGRSVSYRLKPRG